MPDRPPTQPPGRRALVVALALLGLAAGAWLARRAEPGPAGWDAIEPALDARDWPRALALLERRVRAEPGDGRAWLAFGSVHGTLGHGREAADAFGRVGPEDPGRAVAQRLLGDLRARDHDAAGAEAAWRDAIARDPKDTEARTRLVRLLLIERRTEDARRILFDLFRLTGQLPHLRAATSLTLEARSEQFRDVNGELERVERDLAPWLARDPANPWLVRARGLLALDLGRPAEARPDLDAARAGFADDPAVQVAAIRGRLSLGDLDAIDAAWGEPPARPADLAAWWAARGRAELARGRADAAAEAGRKAVEADPAHPAGLNLLAQALAAAGRADEAVPIARQAEEARERFEAIKALLRAERGAADDPAARERLGRLCRDAGLPAEGRGWLEAAVRLDPTRDSAQSALTAAGPAVGPDVAEPRLRARSEPPAVAARPVKAPVPSNTVFEEVAAERGLNFRHQSGATGDLFIADTMGGGVGLFDYDGDGWLDVYLVGTRTASGPGCRLFHNRGGGHFEDATDRAGVPGPDYGMGCAVGDYDGDGDPDLFVSGYRSSRLYRNNDGGRFTDVTDAAGVRSDRWCTAAGFADLDGDADLDLVVVTYVSADPATSPGCQDASGKRIHCPPGKYPAEVDHLFRNNGDGTFTDVARDAGLDVPLGRGLGLAIADLDGDGRLDLFVANDAVPDFLFRNRGGLRFEEVGVASGAAVNGDGTSTASMGVVADDLDGDGRIDLLHTNFRNEGATLLRNLGGGRFADGSAAAGLDAPTRPVTGFGAVAVDGDNDGVLDLFLANGHVDDQPWIRQPMAQPLQWFNGRPGGRYAAAGPGSAGPAFARPVVGRGVAAGDLDNDGRVDLVVVARDGPALLLRNRTEAAGHWLGVRLVGTRSGRDPVGARVTCRAGGRTQIRWVTAGTSYLSSSDPGPRFGLGAAALVEELEIVWPSGRAERRSGVAADRVLTVVEPDGP